jgi:transcriptional regulator with XRE-family HTH domain
MATKITSKTTSAKTVAKADNGYRALRMAKGYGRESLAAALGIRMADVWAIESAPMLSAEDRKALEALPTKGNPLVERTTPVNKPVRTKTAAQIEADRQARLSHPVTVARLAQGYTREGLAQALGISTTALWHLEQSEGSEAKAHAAQVKALPAGTAKAPAGKGSVKATASGTKARKAEVEDLI